MACASCRTQRPPARYERLLQCNFRTPILVGNAPQIARAEVLHDAESGRRALIVNTLSETLTSMPSSASPLTLASSSILCVESIQFSSLKLFLITLGTYLTLVWNFHSLLARKLA